MPVYKDKAKGTWYASFYFENWTGKFVELYTKDVRPRLKENTRLTKENIIQKKILPYFGKRKISEITTKDVIAWQNELLAYRDEQRKPYSQLPDLPQDPVQPAQCHFQPRCPLL